MTLISQKDIDAFKKDWAELEPLLEPITFKQYTGITPGDKVLGTKDIINYNPLELTALVDNLSAEEVASSGGRYQTGDKEFTFRLDFKPTKDDRIVHEGSSFIPKRIDPIYLGEALLWEIVGGLNE